MLVNVLKFFAGGHQRAVFFRGQLTENQSPVHQPAAEKILVKLRGLPAILCTRITEPLFAVKDIENPTELLGCSRRWELRRNAFHFQPLDRFACLLKRPQLRRHRGAGAGFALLEHAGCPVDLVPVLFLVTLGHLEHFLDPSAFLGVGQFLFVHKSQIFLRLHICRFGNLIGNQVSHGPPDEKITVHRTDPEVSVRGFAAPMVLDHVRVLLVLVRVEQEGVGLFFKLVHQVRRHAYDGVLEVDALDRQIEQRDAIGERAVEVIVDKRYPRVHFRRQRTQDSPLDVLAQDRVVAGVLYQKIYIPLGFPVDAQPAHQVDERVPYLERTMEVFQHLGQFDLRPLDNTAWPHVQVRELRRGLFKIGARPQRFLERLGIGQDIEDAVRHGLQALRAQPGPGQMQQRRRPAEPLDDERVTPNDRVRVVQCHKRTLDLLHALQHPLHFRERKLKLIPAISLAVRWVHKREGVFAVVLSNRVLKIGHAQDGFGAHPTLVSLVQ